MLDGEDQEDQQGNKDNDVGCEDFEELAKTDAGVWAYRWFSLAGAGQPSTVGGKHVRLLSAKA